MNENNEPAALITRCLDLCEALQAENDSLRKELDQQYLIRALLEYKRKPKKRGRKPNLKPEINNVPGKLGRPPVFSDRSREMLIEIVDILKEQKGSITDKEALLEFMIESGRYKSRWRAEAEVNKLQVQLSRARNKNKQPTD